MLRFTARAVRRLLTAVSHPGNACVYPSPGSLLHPPAGMPASVRTQMELPGRSYGGQPPDPRAAGAACHSQPQGLDVCKCWAVRPGTIEPLNPLVRRGGPGPPLPLLKPLRNGGPSLAGGTAGWAATTAGRNLYRTLGSALGLGGRPGTFGAPAPW